MTEPAINKLERVIINDEKLVFTLMSYAAILVIFLNLTVLGPALQEHTAPVTLVVGSLASVVYITVNGTFLGNFFFEKESFLVKIVFGNLIFVVFLGLTAWITIIVSNLDIVRTTIALFCATTLASLLNRLRTRHWKWIAKLREP